MSNIYLYILQCRKKSSASKASRTTSKKKEAPWLVQFGVSFSTAVKTEKHSPI